MSQLNRFIRHAIRNTQYTIQGCMNRYCRRVSAVPYWIQSWWSSLTLLLVIFGFVGCAGKVDPILLESSLNDTQNAISDARHLGAKEHATETLAKATRLLDEAQQAQRAGNGIQSLELAFQAQMESQIGGAQARQRIAQNRIEEARAETLRAMVQKMEYKIQIAQARQAIAEEQAKRALARAVRAEQRASAAQAESEVARSNAKKALLRAQTQQSIAKAKLIFDAAKEAGALTYATDDYREAENLIVQARSLLAQDKFDQAKSIAVQAEDRANEAKIAAIAGANAAANESQAAKLQAYTNAKVGITRAQLELDRAESVNAFEHAEALFQRAVTTLEQANMALKREAYDQALQLAARAESSARDAFATAEVVEREHRAKEAKEEQIAQAKDTIFKAEEALNQETSATVTTFSPKLYEQAKTLFADAKQALANENYTRAISDGQLSYRRLESAIGKARRIEAIETQILDAAKAISGAETDQTAKGVLIRFSGELFKSGSSEINLKFLPQICQLAEVIKAYLDYKVRIEGHSDSSGETDANLRLTAKRANTFTKYLAEKCDVPAKRMTPVGLGEGYPIVDNRSKAGQDKNRRIDTIILTRE